MENTPASAVPAPASASAGDAPGFWIRAGAFVIDGVVLAVPSGVLAVALPSGLGAFLRLALAIGYFTALPVLDRGQTLGKKAAGLAIARVDGAPLGYGTTFVRWLGYLVSVILLYGGFLCIPFTEQKRGVHDYIAGTRVVRVEEIGAVRKFLVIAAGVLVPLLFVAGLAAAIAIPSFVVMQKRAAEAGAKSRLGALRAAAAMYRAETDKYPPSLDALVPKYAADLNPPVLPDHSGVGGVESYGSEVCSGSSEPGQILVGARLRGTGKWGYVADPGASCYGAIFIDSAQQDSRGAAFYTY